MLEVWTCAYSKSTGTLLATENRLEVSGHVEATVVVVTAASERSTICTFLLPPDKGREGGG